MADPGRQTTDPLAYLDLLEAEPFAHGFYALLRRYECLHPGRPGLGVSRHAREDKLRIGQDPSLAFAPASIASFRRGQGQQADQLTIRSLGLLGPNGPMPLHLTEYIRDRVVNHGDETLLDFINAFQHRLLSIFYRAWANAEPVVQLERADPDDVTSDRFAMHVASFIGLGLPGLRNRDAMPDYAKMYLSGRYSSQTKNAEGLEAALRSMLSIEAHVEPFTGEWITLGPDEVCELGRNPQSGTLGQSIVLGNRAWQCHQKFRVVLGPMNRAQYIAFLPGSENVTLLAAIVRNYVGDELEWDVRLVLAKEFVPKLQLGVQGQLGWTTFVASGQPNEDMNHFVFEPVLSRDEQPPVNRAS